MKKRIALITGGAKGIGKKITLTLANHGYTVIINYLRSKEEATELAKELVRLGKEAYTIQADVSKKEDVRRLFEEIEWKFGKIDILVHSVGPFIRERKTFYKMIYC